MPSLDVESSKPSTSSSSSRRAVRLTDSDDDDFEDAHSEVVMMDDDDIFRDGNHSSDAISSRRLQPLIPGKIFMIVALVSGFIFL